MRVTAKYSDPSKMPVSLTLSGELERFEQLGRALLNVSESWLVTDLLRAIHEASRELRKHHHIDTDPPQEPSE